MKKKNLCLLCLLSLDGKVRNALHHLKRQSLKTQNSLPTPEMPSPRSLSGSSRTCHAMGHHKRRAEASCQDPVLTLGPLCAHSHLLSFVNCMAWPSCPDEGPGGTDNGSPSSWAMCQMLCAVSYSVRTVTNKMRTIIFCFPNEEAEIKVTTYFLQDHTTRNWTDISLRGKSLEFGPALKEH